MEGNLITDILMNYYKKNNREKDNNLEIEKITTKKNKLLDLYLDKLISKEEYLVRISDYNEKIKIIEGNNTKYNNLNDIINYLNDNITVDKTREIIISSILKRIDVKKQDKSIILNIYLFMDNFNFTERIKFKRETDNDVTYIIKILTS